MQKEQAVDAVILAQPPRDLARGQNDDFIRADESRVEVDLVERLLVGRELAGVLEQRLFRRSQQLFVLRQLRGELVAPEQDGLGNRRAPSPERAAIPSAEQDLVELRRARLTRAHDHEFHEVVATLSEVRRDLVVGHVAEIGELSLGYAPHRS
jgi:hypothetical protein